MSAPGRIEPGKIMAVFCRQMNLEGQVREDFKVFAKSELDWINSKCHGVEYRTIYELGTNELHKLLRKMRGDE